MSQAELDLWAERFQHAGQDAAAEANPTWAEQAMHWIECSGRGSRFTADDIARWIGDPPSRGVAGAVFRRAQEAGLVVGDGFTRSTRLSSRKRALVVWRRC